MAARCRSIETFGLVDPILARRADRRVIAGHQRLIATRRAGLTTVPVILLDLTAEDARLLNVALNRIGGAWDADLLARFDPTRAARAAGAVRPGRGAGGGRPRGPAGSPPARWQLGAHRLFRGDATDAAALARCLGDMPAALVVTDPPDNVNHGACCVSHDARLRWASCQAVSCVTFRSRWIVMPAVPWRFVLSKAIAIAQVQKASGELMISVFELTEQPLPTMRTPVRTAIMDARARTGDGGMETALTLGETIGRLHRPMRWRLGTPAERPGLDRSATAGGVTISALVRQLAAEGLATVVPLGERRVLHPQRGLRDRQGKGWAR